MGGKYAAYSEYEDLDKVSATIMELLQAVHS